MKKIQIYISSFLVLCFVGIGMTYADADKTEKTESWPLQMQHPPHDHHETDHIKKLDEWMRRKRKDEESH